MPGRPASLNEVESVPPRRRLCVALTPKKPLSSNAFVASRRIARRFGRAEHRHAARAAGAGVDVEVAGEVGVLGLRVLDHPEVLLHIRLRSEQALFLAAPERDADRAARLDADRLQDADRLHHHRAADGVVGGAGGRVPRIDVAAEHHHFLRLVAAGNLGDHVVGGRAFRIACD